MAEEKKVATKKAASTTKKTTTTKKAPAKKTTTKKAETAEVVETKTVAKKATAKKATTTKKAAAPKAEKPAKKVAAKKEAKKVEEPKKEEKLVAPVTEAKATALNVRITPRKARLVMNLVRGKSVEEATAILKNLRKAAADPVLKVIKSAAANATNNFNLDESKLFVKEIYATDGIKMKRYLPRAKGSASGLVKRNAHLVCVVKER